MLNVQSPFFLRRILLADALTCVVTGLLMLAGAPVLEPWFGLPSALLQAAGILLLPIAAFIAFAGTRARLSHRMVWAVIAGNALWVMASIALLLSGWVTPTMPGQAFIVVQALAVAVLAKLEYFGMCRSMPMPA